MLLQELARYNRVLGGLRGSLGSLGRALAGRAPMSAELEGVAAALAAGAVPAAWKVGRRHGGGRRRLARGWRLG